MKGPMILTFGGVAVFVLSLAVVFGSFMLPAITNGRTSPAEAMMGIIPGAVFAAVSGLACLAGTIWLIAAANSQSNRQRTTMPEQFGYEGAPGAGGRYPTGVGAAGTQAWQQPSAYAKPPVPTKLAQPVPRSATPGEGRLFLLLGGLALCVVLLGGAVAAGAYVLMNLHFGRDEFRPAQADRGRQIDGFGDAWSNDEWQPGDPNVWSQPDMNGMPPESGTFPDTGIGQYDSTFGRREQERLIRDMEARQQQQLEEFRRQQEEIRRQNEELLRRSGPGLPQPPTPPGFRPPF